MSTPTSTTPTVPFSAAQPPAPRPSGSRTALVAVGAAVVGAAVVAGLVLGFTGFIRGWNRRLKSCSRGRPPCPPETTSCTGPCAP